MYIDYNTTYIRRICSCGVVVSQDWSGESVGMVDIWRFTKTGNVLGVCEDIHTVGGPKCEISNLHGSNALHIYSTLYYGCNE